VSSGTGSRQLIDIFVAARKRPQQTSTPLYTANKNYKTPTARSKTEYIQDKPLTKRKT